MSIRLMAICAVLFGMSGVAQAWTLTSLFRASELNVWLVDDMGEGVRTVTLRRGDTIVLSEFRGQAYEHLRRANEKALQALLILGDEYTYSDMIGFASSAPRDLLADQKQAMETYRQSEFERQKALAGSVLKTYTIGVDISPSRLRNWLSPKKWLTAPDQNHVDHGYWVPKAILRALNGEEIIRSRSLSSPSSSLAPRSCQSFLAEGA